MWTDHETAESDNQSEQNPQLTIIYGFNVCNKKKNRVILWLY